MFFFYLNVIFFLKNKKLKIINYLIDYKNKFKKAYKLDPECRNVVINYSQLLMKIGKSNEAKLILERYIRKNPNDMKV